MRKTWKLNLRIFGEGGGAAGAAGGGDAGGSAEGQAADSQVRILEDGTRMDHRLAERMERQRNRRPNRGGGTAAEAAGSAEGPTGKPAGTGNPERAGNAQEAAAKTPDQEFEELIKGKYSQQYQQRIQSTIQDRFRNQADLQGQLDGLKPMLDALAKQRGIEAGDYETLSKTILDDDSLYEDEAEEAGMTVEAYKTFSKLKAEAEAARAREAQEQQQTEIRNHLQKLAQQGEELKKVFPDFDLRTELNNNAFRRMTAPDIGLSVEQAYYAVHHRELAPQAYAAGIQRAQRQIGQSIQANRTRPVEGAMQGNTAAADVHIDPRRMTREQREELKARARRGEKVVL